MLNEKIILLDQDYQIQQAISKTSPEVYEIDIIDLLDTEEPTTETTEETDIEYITTEGQIVDTRLYLSAPVNNADLNDIYSILLSIRNLFVLFMIMFLFFKVKNIIHSVLAKIFDNGK